MNYYTDVLKKYAVFEGRARRKEFWMFCLLNFLVFIAIMFISGMIHLPFLAGLYWLATLVPSIAVGVRRMHDTDHAGWWVIVPVVSLYFAIIDGTPGPNSYGESPKSVGAPQGFAVVQK